MKENQRICLGCMSTIPIESKTCPLCSFNQDTYTQNPRCLLPGTLLHENYIVGKVIGEGGFGITYIGYDKVHQCPVAIKEYFPSTVASRDCSTKSTNSIYFFDDKDETVYKNGFEKYIAEAKILQHCSDLDGIVSILDFFYGNNTAYIIMEYIEGITLKEYLETNGTLSASDTFELMVPVLLALEQIHAKGIIHRDISPDNIMIRIDGAFKLIDFGAARLTNDENGKSLTIVLKRGFAPEEQYRTHGKQGPWTDVYALCATMYKMITNIVPPEAMDRMVDDEFVSLSEQNILISESQDKTITRGLSVKAANRFQNVKELRLALNNDSSVEKKYHMIATFQERDGKVIGYRLFDRFNKEIVDFEPNRLIEQIQSQQITVENLVVYQKYIQPVNSSIRNYPVLNLLGKLQSNNNYYFVEHTLARGYLCFNYRGEEFYFNEIQMKQELLRKHIVNEEKVSLFTSLRDERAEHYSPVKTYGIDSPTKNTTPKQSTLGISPGNFAAPKKAKKLMLASEASKHSDVSTQLRLRMIKEKNSTKK